MAFNSNIRTRFDVQVAVNDFYSQKAFKDFRGFLQLFTVQRRQRRQSLMLTPQQHDIIVPSILQQQVL